MIELRRDFALKIVSLNMIYTFGGRNFYSFRDPFEVDFRVKTQANQRCIFQTDSREQKVNSVMAIFGANASGKTHLLQALGFLQYLILHSASVKPDEEFDDMYFAFSEEIDDSTDLFIEFEMEGEHYRYEVTLNPKRILKEALYLKKIKFTYIFERSWEGKEYRFKSQDFGEDANKIPQRQNASIISTALLLENSKARQIDHFFSTCYGNLSAIGRTERHDPHFSNVVETAAFFEKERDLLKLVNDRLQDFDLGLTSIRVEKSQLVSKDGKEEEQSIPWGIHVHDGTEFILPLFQESRGTQALFVLLRYILPVLHSGGIAFIDEFELGLHSHMIHRLTDLFYTSRHNRKNAQLIFSCHADFMLSRLEKYQVQLVDKAEDGGSATYRLDAMKGVRNVDNHYAKYHSGTYGGIPNF